MKDPAQQYERLVREALEDADIRVLLMVLFQLTADRKWLADPYKPVRDIRLIADSSAGLSAESAAEVRQAALRLLTADETGPAIHEPDDDLLLELMSICLGEEVAAEYGPMMAQEMGFRHQVPPKLSYRDARRGAVSALVIGAGISGLVAAVKLREAGASVVVLEKNCDIGGTWLENTYPDCGVDTPNHFYSYSFAPNPDWDHYFALRDEIYAYLSDFVDRFNIRASITFGATVEKAVWNPATENWHVTYRTAAGEVLSESVQVLVSAVGQLNRPSVPTFPGLNEFAGTVFHSAQWRHDVDLVGRSVGVVGAGASAMQFVPHVAKQAQNLVIFQRSPHWARPLAEYRASVPTGVKWLLNNVPGYSAWFRFTLSWRFGDGLHRYLKKDPTWGHPERSLNRVNDKHRAELTDYLRRELNFDEELIAKALPTYPPYAKRMLVDNGWYRSLSRTNVELVTEPISAVTRSGIRTADGHERDLDVLILATGFKAIDILGDVDVQGKEGRKLSDRWQQDGPRAYLGIVVPEFPNFFMLYGPNTNLAFGGSIIFHAECQVRYLVDLLAKLVRTGGGSVEVRADVHDKFNQALDAAHDEMVWTHPGVEAWHRNAAGRVISNSPWRLVDYWHMTNSANLDEYLVGPLATNPRHLSAGLDDAAAALEGAT